MLMPIGDDNEGRVHAPIVTYILIGINLAVFFFLQMPSRTFDYSYSIIPREITSGQDLVGQFPVGGMVIPLGPGPTPIHLTILTGMFMHGGFMHLFGNMLYLWIFGDNIEDALGRVKFLAFYLICGIAATYAQIFTDPNSLIPNLGASGAIAGVLGGYLVTFPTRQVRVLIGMLGIIHLPAIIVIGLWGALQFMSGLGSIAPGTEQGGGGVAYWAHIGGFIAGLVLVSLFRNPATQQRVRERINYLDHIDNTPHRY
jgi:membrane associated rhomboid family serine protease